VVGVVRGVDKLRPPPQDILRRSEVAAGDGYRQLDRVAVDRIDVGLEPTPAGVPMATGNGQLCVG